VKQACKERNIRHYLNCLFLSRFIYAIIYFLQLISLQSESRNPRRVGSCRHMTLREVANIGDDRQMWRVPANVLNSPRQPTKGVSPAWGLDEEVIIRHRTNIICQKVY